MSEPEFTLVAPEPGTVGEERLTAYQQRKLAELHTIAISLQVLGDHASKVASNLQDLRDLLAASCNPPNVTGDIYVGKI